LPQSSPRLTKKRHTFLSRLASSLYESDDEDDDPDDPDSIESTRVSFAMSMGVRPGNSLSASISFTAEGSQRCEGSVMGVFPGYPPDLSGRVF